MLINFVLRMRKRMAGITLGGDKSAFGSGEVGQLYNICLESLCPGIDPLHCKRKSKSYALP